MDELLKLQTEFSALVARTSATGRRKLAQFIGRQIAKSQRTRIAQQKDPSGIPYQPRKKTDLKKKKHNLKKKKGRIKKQKMFAKLRTARFLRQRTNANEVNIGFTGQAAYIASKHQYGLTGPVNKKKTVRTRYIKRELLGFTKNDLELIENAIIDHLANS